MQFVLVLLPVFFIFTVGFIGQKVIQFDIRSLSVMTIYLMMPFLAFNAFYTQKLSNQYLYYMVYLVGVAIALIIIVSLVSKYLKYNLPEHCAMILSSVFMNNGNYGVPVILLIFGAHGMALAVILSVLQQLIMSTLGFYYAAKGGEKTGEGFRAIFKGLIRLPVMHGAILGLLCQIFQITVPENLMKSISMIGDSSIPVVMIALGMQLATVKFKQIDLSKMSISLIIKLIISPIIAYFIALYLPVDLEAKQIFVILAAMPTAASTTLLAVQFQTRPDIVSSATFFSTVLSLVTLPILLWLLNPVVI